MKKRILSIIALVMTLVIGFSITSCHPTTEVPNDQGNQTPLIPSPEPTPERFAGTAVRFEAENFASGRQSCPWASEGGFIGGFDSKNAAKIEFNINSSEDATVKLVFSVANTSTSTIFFEDWANFLKINNVSYQFEADVLLHDRDTAKGERYADMYPEHASTAPYLMFDTVEVIVELNSGENIIAFTGGSVTFNFDYIEIVPESDNVKIK